MRRLPALAGVLALGGCAAVFVHTDGRPVQVSFGLLPVTISRGDNDAVAIRRLNIGLYVGCYSGGVGVMACEEFRLDARTCGVGLIETRAPPPPAERNILAKIADKVRAECPSARKEQTQ